MKDPPEVINNVFVCDCMRGMVVTQTWRFDMFPIGGL